MIRLALERDFDTSIDTECAVRIHALKETYGLNKAFLQFYADDQGALASIMDGFCVLDCADPPNEEWTVFLQMRPDIRVIHSTKPCIEALSTRFDVEHLSSGEVLRIDNMSSCIPLQDKNLSISDLHTFLSSVFDHFPPFESWYVDVSHRVRHGHCHIVALQQEGKIVSSAMSVAETQNAVLIGGVATLPTHRSMGLASRCIADLLAMLPQSTVFINPVNEYAAKLYKKIGFAPCGTWAEIDMR